MRVGIVLAALVTGVAAAGAACFSSSSAPPMLSDVDAAPGDDAAPIVDAPFESESAAAEGGTDASPESASSSDAPLDALGPTLDGPPADAQSEASALADAGGGFVRVANMASAFASIDFCVKPTSGAAFGQPYMGLHGGKTVPYESVSEYDALAVASGYVVRVVASGASDCSTALAADVTVGPSPAFAATTVVLTGSAGDGGAPLKLAALTDDDPATSPAGKTRFRVLHAAPGLGPVAYQIGLMPYVEPLQSAVPFGATFSVATATGGAPAPDAQGYLMPGYGQAQVTLVISGTETTSFYVGNGSAPTASATAFLVGASGSSSDPLGFVNCDELAAPDPVTHLSPCTFSSAAPGTATVRIFHGAPDQTAVDVCAGLGPASQPFSSNLLQAAGITGGMAFGQISGVLTTLPTGTDVKVGFAPPDQTCANSGQFLTVGTGLYAHEWTYAMFEYTLPPSTSYDSYLFVTDPSVDPNFARVDFGNLTPIATAPKLDFFVTASASAEMQVGPSAVGPNGSTGFTDLAPGSYALRVADDQTKANLYTTTGAQLTANEQYFAWWIQGSAAQGILARCPLSARSSDSITTCAQ